MHRLMLLQPPVGARASGSSSNLCCLPGSIQPRAGGMGETVGGVGIRQELAWNTGGTFLAPSEPLSLGLCLHLSMSLSVYSHSVPQHGGGSCPGAGVARGLSLWAAAAGGVVRPC